MSKRSAIPVALTIAGSDSGGGAGIQADLKTFAALGVHGTSAITCITAQNPRHVLAIEPCSPAMLQKQIEAVMDELRPQAIKTGMLYSEELMRVVIRLFKKPTIPLIVDPVMVSTSGKILLKQAAIQLLKKSLLPLATLVTPNVSEAEILTGKKIRSIEGLERSACAIHREFGCAALVKGGHLQGVKDAIDIFFDGRTELRLSALFIKGLKTHGTGCTYSAAITAYLALGHDLPSAVNHAKMHITRCIANSKTANHHSVLDNN